MSQNDKLSQDTMKLKINIIENFILKRLIKASMVLVLLISISGCGLYQRLKFNWDYISIFTRSEKTKEKVKTSSEAIKNVVLNRDCYALEPKKEYLELSADELLIGIISFIKEYGSFSDNSLDYEFKCGKVSLEEQEDKSIVTITDQLTDPPNAFIFHLSHNKLTNEVDELSLNNLRRFYALLQEQRMSQFMAQELLYTT